MTISCSGFLKNPTQHLELFRKCNPSNIILNYDKGGGDHTFIPKHGDHSGGMLGFTHRYYHGLTQTSPRLICLETSAHCLNFVI